MLSISWSETPKPTDFEGELADVHFTCCKSRVSPELILNRRYDAPNKIGTASGNKTKTRNAGMIVSVFVLGTPYRAASTRMVLNWDVYWESTVFVMTAARHWTVSWVPMKLALRYQCAARSKIIALQETAGSIRFNLPTCFQNA